MERCPKCGCSQVKSKATMMERAFAVCHVTYCECEKCGNVWEPRRVIHMKLGFGRDVPILDIPDGSTIRIDDGTCVRQGKIEYLDECHVLYNGATAHIDQIRSIFDRHPEATLEIVDGVESKSKKRELLRSRSEKEARYYVEVTDTRTGNRERFHPDEIGCDDCAIDLRTIRSASRRQSMCSICGQPMGSTPSYSKWNPKERVCANCRNHQEQEEYLNGVVTYSKKGRFFVWMKSGGRR